MAGLAEPLGEGQECGTHADVVGAELVMGEREPQELVAQHVVPVAILGGEAGTTQRDKCPVDGWLGAFDRAGELIQSDPVRVDR